LKVPKITKLLFDTNFWVTLPGILTGIAGLITAVGGIYIGYINNTKPQNPDNTFSKVIPQPSNSPNTNKCQNYRVNRDHGLYLCSAENFGKPIITTLPYDTPVFLIKTNQKGWDQIRYKRIDGNTGEGWVMSPSLTCDI